MITVRTQTIKCITLKRERHELPHISGNRIFGLINADAEPCNLNTAYDDFIKAIIEHVVEVWTTATVVALAYTENELQHHRTWHSPVENEQISLFVRKALALCERYRSILLQTISPKCHH